MSELLDFVIVSMVLVAIGIYGLVVKRNAIRMLFSIEIIVNAANLLVVAFSRGCGSWAYHSSLQAIQRN
jgi:NADH:ubiquinone oxidoreductase subunit K